MFGAKYIVNKSLTRFVYHNKSTKYKMKLTT